MSEPTPEDRISTMRPLIGHSILPLRVIIDTAEDPADVVGGHASIIPPAHRTTIQIAALADGVITNYTFDAVGSTTLTREPGSLSAADRETLELTRRLINELLDE